MKSSKEVGVDVEVGEVNPKTKKEKTMKTKKSIKKATAKKATKKTDKKSRASKSGKYKNIRHLMETLFAKKKDMELGDALPLIKKEFPNSAFTDNPNTHFAWYRSKIVSHREFTIVSAPAWAKGGAKVKKNTK